MAPQKIVLLYGGQTPEAKVSAASAAAVAKTFDTLGWQYEKIVFDSRWIQKVQASGADFVYLAVHGGSGENGTVQGALDMLGLPYNGSRVLASALAMDKPRAKVQFVAAGLDVAQSVTYTPQNLPESINSLPLGLPCVVKPAAGGSSLATRIVCNSNEWPLAAADAARYGDVLVEEYIPGKELTVGIINGLPLTITEIENPEPGGFYDYTAKYAPGGSIHHLPARIADVAFQHCLEQAVTAYHALGCEDVARVDFRYDEITKRLVILEANTLPGFTPTSLVPEQAAYKGIAFVDWVKQEVEERQCRSAKVG